MLLVLFHKKKYVNISRKKNQYSQLRFTNRNIENEFLLFINFYVLLQKKNKQKIILLVLELRVYCIR